MASKRDERYSSLSTLFNRSFKLINPIDWHLFKLWAILSSLETIRLNFHFSLSLIINFREKETVKCFIKSNSRIKWWNLSLKIKPIKIHMKESNLSWVNSELVQLGKRRTILSATNKNSSWELLLRLLLRSLKRFLPRE